MNYAALLQLAIQLFGEDQAKRMSTKQLDLLERQLNDIRGIELPDLPQVKAEQLGDSAVAGMRSDPQQRANQLRAIAELSNIIDQGGLDLTDKATLEEAMAAANNQQRRARAGVASDMAARGQYDGGARMMMDLDAAQAGAQQAHRTGMETAAMAQRRRLDAIREVAGRSGDLREQDWREKESAARAKDIRDERNANAREKAQYYNAGLPQQMFSNAMSKATGTQPAANAYGGALGAAGQDVRNAYAGYGRAAYEGARGISGDGGGGGGDKGYVANPNNLALLSDNPYPEGNPSGGGSDPDYWEYWHK